MTFINYTFFAIIVVSWIWFCILSPNEKKSTQQKQQQQKQQQQNQQQQKPLAPKKPKLTNEEQKKIDKNIDDMLNSFALKRLINPLYFESLKDDSNYMNLLKQYTDLLVDPKWNEYLGEYEWFKNANRA